MSHPIHPIMFLRFFPARWHTITGPLAHWRQITAPAVAREKAWFIRTMLPVAAAASRVWHLTKGPKKAQKMVCQSLQGLLSLLILLAYNNTYHVNIWTYWLERIVWYGRWVCGTTVLPAKCGNVWMVKSRFFMFKITFLTLSEYGNRNMWLFSHV